MWRIVCFRVGAAHAGLQCRRLWQHRQREGGEELQVSKRVDMIRSILLIRREDGWLTPGEARTWWQVSTSLCALDFHGSRLRMCVYLCANAPRGHVQLTTRMSHACHDGASAARGPTFASSSPGSDFAADVFGPLHIFMVRCEGVMMC